MTQKELIRQEIERRIGSVNEKQDANPAMPKYRWHMYEGMKEAFIDMKYFIDSLPEETCKDSLQVQETCKENADSFTEDLEKAAKEYVKDIPTFKDSCLMKAAFEDGWLCSKEKMLKDAVEIDVADLNGDIYNNCIEKGMTDEDKVKIVIIKQDE